MTGPGTAVQGVDLLTVAPPTLLAIAAVAVLLGETFLPAERPGAVRSVGALRTSAAPGAGARRAGPHRTGAARRPARPAAAGASAVGAAAVGAVVLALVAELGLAVGVLTSGVPRATFCVPAPQAGAGPVACSYVLDAFAVLIGTLVLAAGLVAVLLALPEIRRTRLPAGEFHFLLLVALAGALALPASRDLGTLVVCLETVSLPVFAMVALRRQDGRSTEAALTMFLVSVASTAVLLFGISLVYGLAGSMHLARIAAALDPATAPPAAAAGIVLVLVGFAVKVSAVPFHAWAPDTYPGAPLAVAAVLAVVSKTAGVAGLLLVLVLGFGAFAPVWGPLVAVLAALSMTVGNLVALRQTGALRLLAWSSIAQAGYVLAPLGALAGAVPEVRDELVAATIGYLAVYAVMTTGAFAVVALVAAEKGGGDGPTLDDFRGLARRHPAVGIAFAFFLACLAGLPPGLAGLVAKIVVVRAVVQGGYGWLAVLVVLNTAVGLAYYLAWAYRVVAPREPVDPTAARRSGSIVTVIGLVAVPAVLLSVLPQPVLAGWLPG